ncbi:hypothetical protein Lser_V15G41107 [Lactuca serriola]
MEEDNGFDPMEQLEDGIHVVNSSNEIQKLVLEEADKKYQLLTLALSRIKKDITRRNADEYQINLKLMWFSDHEYYIRWRTQEIMDLERCLVKHEIHLPKNVGPSRTGFSRLPEKDDPVAPFRPDRKRSQKMLIKKGRVDTHYLQQVHDELLSSKKTHGITPSGEQEVNDLMESMAQRIQHGNKNRADEMRIYNEMRKVKETREIYTTPEPNNHNRNSKPDIDSQRFIQCRINILLDEIEEMKMKIKERQSRFIRLKAELKLVRKSISCLKKELKHVNTKRSKAYKHAYELGVQFSNTTEELAQIDFWVKTAPKPGFSFVKTTRF